MTASTRWRERRGRGRVSVIAVLISVGWLGPTIAMSPPVSAATAQVLKTMQFNLCGAQCYGGSLSIADSVVNDIRSSGAQLITLNEVCIEQYNRITTNTGFQATFTIQVAIVPT